MADKQRPQDAVPLVIARPQKKLGDMTDEELDGWADSLYEKMAANYAAVQEAAGDDSEAEDDDAEDEPPDGA